MSRLNPWALLWTLLILYVALATVFAARVLFKSDGYTAQPQFDYVNTYTEPYNITVTCKHRGGPGKINPKEAPEAGQVLIRKCVVRGTN